MNIGITLHDVDNLRKSKKLDFNNTAFYVLLDIISITYLRVIESIIQCNISRNMQCNPKSKLPQS